MRHEEQRLALARAVELDGVVALARILDDNVVRTH